MDSTTQIIISIIGLGITVIATAIAVVTFLYTVIRNFKSDIDIKFKEMSSLISSKFSEVDIEIKDIRSDIKDMRNDIKELRTSLNRIEGAFYSKECCMLKEDRQAKKAE